MESALEKLAQSTETPEVALTKCALEVSKLTAAGAFDPNEAKLAVWAVASKAGIIERTGDARARSLLAETWALASEMPIQGPTA